MSDEKKYSERELVRAKREAGYEMAIAWVAEYNMRCACTASTPKASFIELDAKSRYQLPLITRPRVLTIGDLRFRLVDNKLHWRQGSDGRWWCSTLSASDMIGLLSRLADNPTETVPDEDISNV